MKRVVVVRYSEIGLKGKNRRRFEKILKTNLERVTGWKVTWRWGRMYVEVDWKSADLEVFKRIFGIQNYSPAYITDADFDSLVSASEELVMEELERGSRRFKVGAKRVSKDFPMGVYDINRELGAFILRRFAGSIEVDVHDPDFVLGVEIRDEGAVVYTRKYRAYGGLPVGVSGKALLLLSGGIDSPVAGWYALKRGVIISALSFISPPYTDAPSKEKILDLMGVLSGYSGGRELELYFCPLTPVLELITSESPERYWLILQRRSMMRIASRLAGDIGAVAIYTGESVGQVASQTLVNLMAVESVARYPVMRPLCGMDKVEIVEKAKEIGTYEISIRKHLDVCSVFSPKHPTTGARLDRVEEIESSLGEELRLREEKAFEEMERHVLDPRR